jgi:DNA-binding NarL/FixJ family response regulator
LSAGLHVKDLSIEGPILALSRREGTVLRLIAWGHTNKEIAQQLEISVKTVEAHKANGMRKLGLLKRSELVRYAVSAGWLARDLAMGEAVDATRERHV